MHIFYLCLSSANEMLFRATLQILQIFPNHPKLNVSTLNKNGLLVMRSILKYWLCVYSLPGQSFAVRSFQTRTSLSGSFGRPRTENWAARVVQGLSEIERSLLLRELTKYKCPPTQGVDVATTGGVSRPVSSSHTRLVFLANGLPFIGFGFLDNCIMIVAGEYIDLSFSSVFGLSTMAAAGLGNWISDLCG
ncbi:uncharacterized protein DEA37_0007852, partial [Paragonimus westermani]